MDKEPKDPAKVAVVVQPGFVPLDVAIPQQVFGPWPDQLTASRAGGSPYELSLAGHPLADGRRWRTRSSRWTAWRRPTR
ncbi:hypothetical protein ACLQ2E_24185 [Streptomyces lavendulocolor]